nr:ribonuclease H-like domain-containing protein [Tanacetum cinerariifolium]
MSQSSSSMTLVPRPFNPSAGISATRSLYGLKQAPRAWFQWFAACITIVGFTPSRCDSSLFIYKQGILVTRDSYGMFLSQRKYAMEILERAHMVGCNPSRTPVDTESKLGDGGTLVVDPTLYQSLAGDPHFSALKRILRAEAEYRGVANAVAETCWIRNLLRELHTPLSSSTIMYCDNVSAVYLSSNPVQH